MSKVGTTDGETLKRRRNFLRLSREKLANQLGDISSSTIKRAETGDPKVNRATVERIAAALGMAESVRGFGGPDVAAELAVISDRLREIAEKMLSGREIEDFSDSATQRPTAAEQALKPAGERGR